MKLTISHHQSLLLCLSYTPVLLGLPSIRALSIWITIDFTKAILLHSLSIYDTSLDLLRWMDTPSIDRRHDDTHYFLYKALFSLLFYYRQAIGGLGVQGSGLGYLLEHYAIPRGQIVSVTSQSGYAPTAQGKATLDT
jgi:hypothetical protein